MFELVQLSSTLALFGGLTAQTPVTKTTIKVYPERLQPVALRAMQAPKTVAMAMPMLLVPNSQTKATKAIATVERTKVTPPVPVFDWKGVIAQIQVPSWVDFTLNEEPAASRKESVEVGVSTGTSRDAKSPWKSLFTAKTNKGSAQPMMPLPLPAQPAEVKPKPEIVAVKTQGSSAIPVAPRVEDKLCTVNAVGATISTILATLSKDANVNIVLVSPADTPITVRLNQMRLGEALQHICTLADLAYLKVSNSYLVGAPARLKAGYPTEWAKAHPNEDKPEVTPEVTVTPEAPPIIFKSVFVSNVTAESLQTVLKALFPDTNLSVVVGPVVARPAVTGGSGGDTVNENSATSQGSSASGTSSIPARSIIIRGPKPTVEEAVEIAKSLDVKRAQVAIAVSIHDVTDDALRDLGLSHTPGGTTVSETDPKGINFGSFIRTPLGFTTTIKALETKNLAKMLAKPNITALDMEQAYVLMGNRINLPRLERLDANGSPVYTVEETKVGIYLQVQPQIAEDGEITLSVKPQVSTISGFIEVNGASYPNIATREAQTSIRVKSGETIVMGGLLRTEDIDAMDQTPILSKIPIFGELFKHRKKTKSASQVIITMTPMLVQPDKP